MSDRNLPGEVPNEGATRDENDEPNGDTDDDAEEAPDPRAVPPPPD